MAETTSYLSSPYTNNTNPDDPDVIRANIEETRARMTRTVNSIQEILSPERLARQAKDTIREATIGKVEEMAHTASHKANRMTNSLLDTIRQNPVPAAMVGIGLGWLLMRGSNPESRSGGYHYYPDSEGNYRLYTSDEWNGPYDDESNRSTVAKNVDYVRDKASDAAQVVQEKAGEIAGSIQDTAKSAATTVGETAHAVQTKAGETAQALQTKASEMVSSVQQTTREQASYLANQAQTQARYAKDEYQYLLETNPLALGVVAVAAGAIIGLMLPQTQAENQLMGETRDRLVDQAKVTAKETAKKVQVVAEEAYQAAKETAMEEAEYQDLPVPGKETTKGETERRNLPVAK